MAGRTVRIYLKEGTPNSLLIAEIINWTGKVLVISRSQLFKIADRTEVKQTGTYILVGQDLDEITRERIYIGEGDNVWKRLKDHDNDPKQHNSDADNDFWDRTIVVISKDENLTKAHGRYLESRLLELARRADRATIANDNKPPRPPLPESDIDDMDYFLEQIQMLLPVLGFSFLQTLPPPESLRNLTSIVDTSESSPLFCLNLTRGAFAEAREINGDFIVLAGSQAKKTDTQSLRKTQSILREQLRQARKLVDDEQNNFLIFTEDILFSSPSAAASIVTGAQSNGHVLWKVKESGQTYKEWKSRQLHITDGLSEEQA